MKWFAKEEGSAAATALVLNGDGLIAPDLIIAEVCSAAWKSMRVGKLRVEQFAEVARELPTMFEELVPLSKLCGRACEIASSLDHPVYDTLYVALAELRDIPLMTADARLLRRVQGSEWQSRVLLLPT